MEVGGTIFSSKILSVQKINDNPDNLDSSNKTFLDQNAHSKALLIIRRTPKLKSIGVNSMVLAEPMKT